MCVCILVWHMSSLCKSLKFLNTSFAYILKNVIEMEFRTGYLTL